MSVGEVCISVIDMSILASMIIVIVLVLRLLFKRAPGWIRVLLWGIVALRLIIPTTIESPLSLVPDNYPIENFREKLYADTIDNTDGGKPLVIRGSGGAESEREDASNVPSDAGKTAESSDTGEEAKTPGAAGTQSKENDYDTSLTIPLLRIDLPDDYEIACIWLAGLIVMLAYMAISRIGLGRKLREAVLLRDNIYQSDRVNSAFVLGFFKPRIYVPFGIEERELETVIEHERAHIRRRDNKWKPLGFAILAVHWFNPLVWLSYVLFCRDIEFACDEKVIKKLDNEQRADYMQALLSCSVSRSRFNACPLAFGEVGIKERVKTVMNYRKPSVWVILIAVLACAALAVCFLTCKKTGAEFEMKSDNIADIDPDYIVSEIRKAEKLNPDAEIYTRPGGFSSDMDSDFELWDNQTIVFYFKRQDGMYCEQLRFFGDSDMFFLPGESRVAAPETVYLLEDYLNALKYMPKDEIRRMCPNADLYLIDFVGFSEAEELNRVITYSKDGVTNLGEKLIHIVIGPMHGSDEDGYSGTGDEMIHLFYGTESAADQHGAAAELWFDASGGSTRVEKSFLQFPNAVFSCTDSAVEVNNGKTTVLYGGLPVRDAYICDINGDGSPDFCSTINIGSGIVDSRVIICDYANGKIYVIEDRGKTDYMLRTDNAGLLCLDRFDYNSVNLISSEYLTIKPEYPCLPLGAFKNGSFT